jgi:hypothetical protein
MKQYRITLHGESPLLMHADNMMWQEKVSQWRMDPANKKFVNNGDDRTPSWTWLGHVYHDRKVLGIPSDNLMTMLREGGAKVPFQGKETFKKQTQAGIVIDQPLWPLTVSGKEIPVAAIDAFTKMPEISEHIDAAEKLGFELLIKRARVASSKHVRVRPLFRDWACSGSLTITDPQRTGITKKVLQLILDNAGALVGIGDWRPSSPKASGTYGRFVAEVEEL